MDTDPEPSQAPARPVPGTVTHEASLPIDWIGSAKGSVSDSLMAWANGRLAELPVGLGWDVMRLPGPEGWETVRQVSVQQAALGPVLHTRCGVEFFVPPRSASAGDLPRAVLLGEGETVEVPPPDVVAPRTFRARTWIVPPRCPGGLTEARTLYAAYAAAVAKVRAVRERPR
ncbi:hypothetical protein [Streptomyces sulphureus]|uniref:hypothetical protein n=1 Tax=Streptomyces sulphureus TaxID=47758 RepID=UPI000476B72A|nr:hypothetical protein [Streptomyces sulphureus]